MLSKPHQNLRAEEWGEEEDWGGDDQWGDGEWGGGGDDSDAEEN